MKNRLFRNSFGPAHVGANIVVLSLITAFSILCVGCRKSLPPEQALYDKHAKATTLFQYSTAMEFSRNGWGKAYANLIREKWTGRDQAGISLRLRHVPNPQYEVGKNLDVTAVLSNNSKQPRSLNVGGDCGMTHSLRFLIIDSKGRLFPNVPKAMVGGPHCRCHSTHKLVGPGQEVMPATGFRSGTVAGWTFTEPGNFIIVATYTFETAKGKYATIYSPPLVVKAREGV